MPMLDACIDGTLDKVECKWRSEAATCVVMASGGYPDAYETGKVITGLDRANALEDVTVFHAGTQMENGDIATGGGRVLGVTALGRDIKSAIEGAYRGVKEIDFDQAHFRTDIGYRALDRTS